MMLGIAAIAVLVMLAVFHRVRYEGERRHQDHLRAMERLRRNHFLAMEHDAQMYAKMETMIHGAMVESLAQYSLEHRRKHSKGGK